MNNNRLMKRLLTSAALLLCSMAMLAQFTGTVTDEQGVQYTANDDETTCYVSGHASEYSSSIVIPESYEGRSVTSIGGGAFWGCRGLTSITLPERLASIGGRAFRLCTSLTSITLPDGLTSIGSDAFSGCTSLTSITLPDGLTSIGEGAFAGCSGLTSITLSERLTSIGDYAFNGCSGLTSISLPQGLTSIGGYAFNGCSGLTSITFPNGLSSIGNSAFQNCSSLASIMLPAGLTSIGNSVFRDCSSLASIMLPAGLTSIGNSAFYGCSSLASIMLPDGLTSIGNFAFYGCSGLTSITLSERLTSIGDYAFERCTGLTSLTLPDGLSSIGNSAFTDCSSLASIMLPAGLTSIGNSAFYGCSGLTSLTLPDGLTSIGNDAFRDCSSLASIMLPDGLTSIGNSVFQDCSRLASIMLPAGLTSIGNSAFSNCSGLTSISFPDGLTSIGNSAFYGCSGLTSISLPDGLTSIGNSAFYGCSGLTSISFPDGLASIGDGAFSRCTGLTSLTLPDSLSSIGNSVFQDCSSLASIMLPAGLTSIGNNAFSNCSRLTSINIPESLKVIGSDAFSGCLDLWEVDYASMESLCNITFGNFYSNPICYHVHCPLYINGNEVTDVIIPEGVSSIRNYTFCHNIFNSITIPKSVTSIGRYAFGWNQASVFVMRREPAPIESSANVEGWEYAFDNSNASLYVPLGCKAAYEAADVWKDFKEIVELNLDNYLYANEVTIRPGGKKTIALQLDDVKTLIAGEFRLQLPVGFSIEKDENGYLKAELVSERDNHHSFEATDEGNGRYHFLCYSGQNRAFKGDSGDFIKLTIVADEDVEENSYSAEVNDIIFSDENEQQVDIDNSTFNISVVDYVPGDANHDGLLNVMDIVKVVGKIMGNPTSDFFFAAADIDDNSKVNVMDLVNLVEIIMNTASQAPAMTAFDQTAAISGGLDLFKADEKTITMNVTGATNHIAAQFYVSLSGKAVLNDVVSDKAHKTEFTRLDDGRYLVMVYSGSNATFKDDCPIKLQVSSDCSAMIEDVVFIDADNAPVAFEAAELGNTQGIMSIGASFEQPADIYSVSGKLIKRGATSTLGLTKGVYVVNNEKIIVK